MKYFHARRLVKLANFLLTEVPNDNFCLADFFRLIYSDNSASSTLINELNNHNRQYIVASDIYNCNTTACALGWACAIPQFRRAGLKASINDQYSLTVNYKNYVFFEAGQKFFGISPIESYWLFDPGQYSQSSSYNITKYDVVKRIKQLLKNYSYTDIGKLILFQHK